jgi:ABC-type spermidine/putrescine transport system permease subunit II
MTFSFDDVIISLFVQRPGTSTLPIHILSSFKPGLKRDVAAVVVITFVVSLIGVLSAVVLLMRGDRRGRAPRRDALLTPREAQGPREGSIR